MHTFLWTQKHHNRLKWHIIWNTVSLILYLSIAFSKSTFWMILVIVRLLCLSWFEGMTDVIIIFFDKQNAICNNQLNLQSSLLKLHWRKTFDGRTETIYNTILQNWVLLKAQFKGTELSAWLETHKTYHKFTNTCIRQWILQKTNCVFLPLMVDFYDLPIAVDLFWNRNPNEDLLLKLKRQRQTVIDEYRSYRRNGDNMWTSSLR